MLPILQSSISLLSLYIIHVLKQQKILNVNNVSALRERHAVTRRVDALASLFHVQAPKNKS